MKHNSSLFSLYLICLLASTSVFALKEFKTDYCTFFPEGTFSKPRLWAECCLEHDIVYWAGGTKQMQDLSDELLASCVTEKSSSFYGGLMYRGVRMGHYSPIKSKTKWGHGWGDNRSFQKLTNKEKDIIKEQLIKASNIRSTSKAKYLKTYID